MNTVVIFFDESDAAEQLKKNHDAGITTVIGGGFANDPEGGNNPQTFPIVAQYEWDWLKNRKGLQPNRFQLWFLMNDWWSVRHESSRREALGQEAMPQPFSGNDEGRLKTIARLRNLPHFYGVTFEETTPHDFYHRLWLEAQLPFSILKTGWDGQKFLPGREVIEHIGGEVLAPPWPKDLLANIPQAQMAPQGVN